MPPGSTRYLSWLFAARAARSALLGIYALTAEWRALMDPATEHGVAALKLAWWREELGRLHAGAPLHPITRYLAQFPTAASAVEPLARSLEAAAAQIAGAPLERARELESHAGALYGAPLEAAAGLDGGRREPGNLRACVVALASGQYLAEARTDYRRAARVGRISFAVDELLAAGIDNADLAAGEPPPHLLAYLEQLRDRAARYFEVAQAALTAEERAPLRHLAVLAALGARRLRDREARSPPDFRLVDLYNAWNAARRAAATR